MNKLFSSAIEAVRYYVHKAVHEEDSRGTELSVQNTKALRDFVTDVNQSERFQTADSMRELYEVYHSLVTNPFIKGFIHNGAAYVYMSLGEVNYNELVNLMANGLRVGYKNELTDMNLPVNLDHLLQANPWLVFCLLCRYVWFNEPDEKVG